MARLPTFPILYDEVEIISISNYKKLVRGITVDYLNDPPFIDVDYYYDGKRIKYNIPLVSVPSNLGKGRIWYFLCPSTGKRCRKLYFIRGKYYHREAFKGCMYETQTKSHRWRQIAPLVQVIFRRGKFNLKRKYFKSHYRGKPTKRFLWLAEKMEKIRKDKLSYAIRFLRL